MLTSRILVILFVVPFVYAVTLTRLCERMTSCDLYRFIRTHKRQISSVDEKTIRVNFLASALENGSAALHKRVEFLEKNYETLRVERSYEIQLRNSYVENDFKQAIQLLNETNIQLNQNVSHVDKLLQEVKEYVYSAFEEAKTKILTIQHLKEEVNTGKDTVKSVNNNLKHHEEEVQLIESSRSTTDKNMSTEQELTNMEDTYNRLEEDIDQVVSHRAQMNQTADTTGSDFTEIIRLAGIDLNNLKIAISSLVNSINDTESKCINKNYELASKLRSLYVRIKALNSRKITSWG